MKYTVSSYGVKSKKTGVTGLAGMKKNGVFRKGGLERVCNLVLAGGALKTREQRMHIRTLNSADGLHGDDTLAYADSGKLYYGGLEISGLYLTLGKKDIYKLGKFLVIFPDMAFVNTENLQDYGYLSASTSAAGAIASVVNSAFSSFEYTVAEELPEQGVSGEYVAIQDENKAWSVKKYNGSGWQDEKTYIKLQTGGMGQPFRPGDVVLSTGFEKIGLTTFEVIKQTNDMIYVEGFIDGKANLGRHTVTRYIPEFDFVAVSGDRLVGVRRGADSDGEYVCKMYASAMHTPFNFLPEAGGLELTLNVCGAFTGMCDFLGAPVAFTESEIIEGRYKSGQLVASIIKGYGVERGAHKSIACANGRLYYKSSVGVCEYDGSYPECISSPIGALGIGEAGAPAVYNKGKYYIKLTDNKSQSAIYVYDIKEKLWFMQDDPSITAFACRGDDVYALSELDGGAALLLLDGESASEADREYLTDEAALREGDVLWELVSSDIGTDSFDSIRPIRVVIRLIKELGSNISIGIIYDEATLPEREFTTDAQISGAVTVPITLRRCDTFKLKISGSGRCKIFGYAVQMREGGVNYGWR